MGVSGNFPSISGDKLSLYYIAQLDGIAGELRRITRAAPGQPWSVPSPVPGVIQLYSSIDISRDEPSIVLAPPLTESGAPSVLISRRQP